MILIDFVDKLGMRPETLFDDQMVVTFHSRAVIQTDKKEDGQFGGAYVKIGLKETDLKFASSTMTVEEIKQYIMERYLYRFY